MIASKAVEKDGRTNSIEIRLAPMSVCVFRCTVNQEDAADVNQGFEKAKNILDGQNGGENQKKLVLPPINPAKTAKAAGEAIAQKGADALDKLSETVGKIINKKK